MQDIDWSEIGGRIRAWREGQEPRVSLDELGRRIAERASLSRAPSAAKLSRIETGAHPAAPDILPALAAITGIPAADIRPDLARAVAA